MLPFITLHSLDIHAFVNIPDSHTHIQLHTCVCVHESLRSVYSGYKTHTRAYNCTHIFMYTGNPISVCSGLNRLIFWETCQLFQNIHLDQSKNTHSTDLRVHICILGIFVLSEKIVNNLNFILVLLIYSSLKHNSLTYIGLFFHFTQQKRNVCPFFMLHIMNQDIFVLMSFSA